MLVLSCAALTRIQTCVEGTYPEEGAGLLLGTVDGHCRFVAETVILPNAHEPPARRTRYEFSPQALLDAHEGASRRDLDVIGVFHSHPDHPSRPSDYDRQRALPWLSYLIASVYHGRVVESRAWRLTGAEGHFQEERLAIAHGGYARWGAGPTWK